MQSILDIDVRRVVVILMTHDERFLHGLMIGWEEGESSRAWDQSEKMLVQRHWGEDA